VCGCGCGCGTRVATPPACRSAAPPCWAPGSKSLQSAFLHVLPCARHITVYDDAGPKQEVLEMENAGGDLSHVHKVVIMDHFLSRTSVILCSTMTQKFSNFCGGSHGEDT
jgi:hypothetical protein